MKIGDKVSYSKYHGEIIVIDSKRGASSRPCHLIEYQIAVPYAWRGNGITANNQDLSIKDLLRANCYYFWHYLDELHIDDAPPSKMISGINCTQCNTYNKYMELPEDKVSSWICTPCKS